MIFLKFPEKIGGAVNFYELILSFLNRSQNFEKVIFFLPHETSWAERWTKNGHFFQKIPPPPKKKHDHM
jgi:hypothetical protein